MKAARDGELDVIRCLMENGAAVDASDNDGRMSLVWASRYGKLDVMQYLVKNGAAVDSKSRYLQTPHNRAAERGDLGVLRSFLDGTLVVNAFYEMTESPLMWTAFCGHLDIVYFLVAHSADLKSKRYIMKRRADAAVSNKSGETPLMWATCYRHLDVVRLLVNCGAIANVSSGFGWTPVLWTYQTGNTNMYRFLVEHGAKLDCREDQGWRPRRHASASYHWDEGHSSVAHEMAANASDNDNEVPLMRAKCHGLLDAVQTLVDCRAMVDIRDKQGWTPLMQAVRHGYSEVVRFLVEHGAAVDAHSSSSSTPLMLATYNGDFDMIRFLVERGADVNIYDNEGWTPLIRAAKKGKLNMNERTETKNRNQHATVSSHIPSGWLISPFEIEVEPFIDDVHISGDYRGKWLNADVVVKLFVADISSATFVDKVRLWHQLRHPNVLKLYGVCNSHHHFFVCEYASRGSLPDYLRVCDPDCRTPWKFLYEAALGLEYLHERKTVHGDLQGSNILIGSDGLAKLSGFGSSASQSEKRLYASRELVTWEASEKLRRNEALLAFDMYSLGICIIEAVSGKVPLDEFGEEFAKCRKKLVPGCIKKQRHLLKLTDKQVELVIAMCSNDPRKRLKMPAIVDKLERFAEIEAAELAQHRVQPEPDSLIDFYTFDHGTSTSWLMMQAFVDKSVNDLYSQIYCDLEMICNTLKVGKYPRSTLESFHDLLAECRLAIDVIAQQNQIRRLSATRARDYSIRGLHRRIDHLLQLVRPYAYGYGTREMEWKRLCREQIEIFVSEASEACVMLSSVDSEEDRLALVTVFRAELRNIDGRYTEKQLAVLQKTHDKLVSESLEDVRLASTPEWFIPWFELEMNEMATLGEGGFGSVIKAKWLNSEVVVKKLEVADRDAGNDDKKRAMRQMFEREVDIWFGLSHPHVVRLCGACHVGRLFFVCELAPNGTLDEYLRCHSDELWVKLREAALGVQYLQACGIAHGDLKGNNILIQSDGKAKVTDFGLSGVFGDDSTEIMLSGAWHWVAPEYLLGQKPTYVSDIYSFGMCIVEALRVTNGDKFSQPWGNLPNPAVKFHVTKKHLLPQRPKTCSDEARTLIERMCTGTAAERMMIMTVVDELKKLTVRQVDLSGETDQSVSDICTVCLLSSSVANTLAEMQDWIAKCDTRLDWEGDVLKNIYQLLWNRLELVGTQLRSNYNDTIADITTTKNFIALVKRSQLRTWKTLRITDDIPLVKFTELALGGYALHRRLAKFIATHAVPRSSSPIHDWTSACRSFMRANADPHPACSKKERNVKGREMANQKIVLLKGFTRRK